MASYSIMYVVWCVYSCQNIHCLNYATLTFKSGCTNELMVACEHDKKEEVKMKIYT